MVVDKNRVIPGRHSKDILLDIYYISNGSKKPVIIFAHGFKGFKDWGHFSAIANRFAEKGFVFIKFNFSHNGTTKDKPTLFADLEAFGQNNYSKEQDDLGTVIDSLEEGILLPEDEVDMDNVYLLGHSRGGAMTIIKAKEDDRIKKVVTWGSPGYIGTRFSDEELKLWKKKGVVYFPNSRTGQQMPMYWQIMEDYQTNEARYDLSKVTKGLKKPLLVVHGTLDDTITYEEGKALASKSKNAELVTIEGANHTFGGTHPFIKEDLPLHTRQAIKATLEFFKKS